MSTAYNRLSVALAAALVCGCAGQPDNATTAPVTVRTADEAVAAGQTQLFRASPQTPRVHRVIDGSDDRRPRTANDPSRAPGPSFSGDSGTLAEKQRLASYFIHSAKEDMLNLDFSAALENYRRALQLDPDNLEARLGENEAARMLGTHDPILGHPDEE